MTPLVVLFLKSLLGEVPFEILSVIFLWFGCSVFTFNLGDTIFNQECSLVWKNIEDKEDLLVIIGLILIGPVFLFLFLWIERAEIAYFIREKVTIQLPIAVIKKVKQ